MTKKIVLLVLLFCIAIGLIVCFLMFKSNKNEGFDASLQPDNLDSASKTFFFNKLSFIFNGIFPLFKKQLLPDNPFTCPGSTVDNVILNSKTCPGNFYLKGSSCNIGCCAGFKAGISRITGLENSKVQGFENSQFSVNYKTKQVFITGELVIKTTASVYVDLAFLLSCGGSSPEGFSYEGFCAWYDLPCLAQAAYDAVKDPLVGIAKDAGDFFTKDIPGFANKSWDAVRDTAVSSYNSSTDLGKKVWNNSTIQKIKEGTVFAANRIAHDVQHPEDAYYDLSTAGKFAAKQAQTVAKNAERLAFAAAYRIANNVQHPEDFYDDLIKVYDLAKETGEFVWNNVTWLAQGGGWRGAIDHKLIDVPLILRIKVAFKTTEVPNSSSLKVDLRNLDISNANSSVDDISSKAISKAYYDLYDKVLLSLAPNKLFKTIINSFTRQIKEELMDGVDLGFITAITSTLAGTIDTSVLTDAVVKYLKDIYEKNPSSGEVTYTIPYVTKVLDVLYLQSVLIFKKGMTLGDWTLGETPSGNFIFQFSSATSKFSVCYNRVNGGALTTCNKVVFEPWDLAYMPRMFRVSSWVIYAPVSSEQLIFYYLGSTNSVVINKAGKSLIQDVLISPFELNNFDSGLLYARIDLGSYIIAQDVRNNLTITSKLGGKVLVISSSGSFFSTPKTQYDNSVRFLDRQRDIDCTAYGSALNKFKLRAPARDGLSYDVVCGGIDPQFLSSATVSRNTPENGIENGDIKFLDRHNLDCGTGVMTKFALNTRGDNMTYEYDCKDLQYSSKVCRTVETDWAGGSNSLEMLDGLDVKCREDESISQFQILNGANFGKWDDWNKYRYTCCKSTDFTSNSCSGECGNLLSENGFFRAIVQDDGNFVIYKDTDPVWYSATYGQGKAPYKLVMQTDGNLVLYDSTQKALWQSGTSGKGTRPYVLTLQNDGNLQLIDSLKTAIWSSKCGINVDVCVDSNIISPAYTYRAAMNPDGNFVIYKQLPIWSTRTSGQGKGPYCLRIQPDGNLGVIDSADKASWYANSYNRGKGPYKLNMQDDGNLVLYDSNSKATWSSRGGVVNVPYVPPYDSYVKVLGPSGVLIDKPKPKPKDVCAEPNMISPSYTYIAAMQPDGNLVIYQQTAVWDTKTSRQGKGPFCMRLQTDGNLGLYDSTNKPSWYSNSYGRGKGPYSVALQNNGSFQIIDCLKTVIWSSS